jgi:threonine-phosphate decarboxylase
LGTPEPIKKAIASAIAEGAMTFSPDKEGVHLSNNLARYFEISPECFLIGTSPAELISNVAQAYRPCNVGIPTPAPAEYFLSVANVGHNPVKLVNSYSLSAIEPQTAIQNGIRFEAAILGNPSFPCARLLNERTLQRYLDHCNWVIIDESSITLTMGGDSYMSLAHKNENLIVIRNLSEELGMPGIPMSYAVGHPDTIKLIRQFCDGSSIGMFHEIVARELPNIIDYQERTNTLIDKEIPWMQCMLSLIPGIRVFPSEANFVMCALEERSARLFGIADASDLVVRLQTAGFGLRDLTGIPGIEANRYFLVCIRNHEENEKLIAAMRKLIVERPY